MNYYEKLGLSSNATDAEIKSAYRRLSLKYHPDRNKSKTATKKFIEITEAYNACLAGNGNNGTQQKSQGYDDPFGAGINWDDMQEFWKRASPPPPPPRYTWDWGQTAQEPAIDSKQVRELLRYDVEKRPGVFSQYGFTCDGCHKAYLGGNMIFYFAQDKKLCRDCKKDIIDWFDDMSNFR